MSLYQRPKGDVRFQELSEARQPLPSAELDNELNLLKDWLNASAFAITLGSNLLIRDAALAPVTVDLANYSEVTVIKTDISANAVSITDTSGKTVLQQSSIDLTMQDESIHLIKNGTNWYRI